MARDAEKPAVLVTGASGGIGQAIAVEMAGRGWRLALTGRDQERLEITARACGTPAGDQLLLGCDLTDEAEVDRTVETLVASWGTPAAVVFAHGIFALAPAERAPAELFRDQLEVNLTGVFLTLRAVLPHLYAAGRGHLLAIGSVAAKHPLPGNAAYSASKYGLRGLMEVVHAEAAPHGLVVSMVHPPATATPLWDRLPAAERAAFDRTTFLDPGQVAGAVAGLLSDPPASFNDLDLF